MKKTKNIILLVFVFIALIIGIFLFVNNFSNDEIVSDSINMSISVYDKENNLIYNEKINTNKMILGEVVKEIDDLEITTEDGPYGYYITSIKGETQGDNYYWNYYVNENYASVGISSYKVQENDRISFKLEYFGKE